MVQIRCWGLGTRETGFKTFLGSFHAMLGNLFKFIKPPLRASLIAQLVKNLPAVKETLVQFLGREDPLEKGEVGEGYPLQYSWASFVAQLVKNPPEMQETWVQSLHWEGLGRSPGERKGYLLQYSGLENSMHCIIHGVTKSWT